MQEIRAGLTPENFARLNDVKFDTRMVNYRNLFRRTNAWDQESAAITGSACAQAIVARNNNRYQETVAVALEQRMGSPVKLADYDATIQSVAAAVSKLAKKSGFKSKDTDFALLTFTQACLDQMGVAETASPEPLATDEKMFDRINQTLEVINAKGKMAVIQNKMTSDPVPPRSGVWHHEQQVIAQHPLAVREFVTTGSRIKALAIAALEDIKTEGPLNPQQLEVARKLADTISPSARKLGYAPNNEDTDMEQVIGRMVGFMEIPLVSGLSSLRTGLRSWNDPQTSNYDSFRVNEGLKLELDQITTILPITELIDSHAKGISLVLNCPTTRSTKTQLGSDYYKYITLTTKLMAGGRGSLNDFAFLRMLTNPKMAEALTRYLNQPSDSTFDEANKAHIVTQIHNIGNSDDIKPRVILGSIMRTNQDFTKALVRIANRQTDNLSGVKDQLNNMNSPQSYALKAKENAQSALRNSGISTDGNSQYPSSDRQLDELRFNLREFFSNMITARSNLGKAYRSYEAAPQVRFQNLVLSLLYPCPSDIARMAVVTRISGLGVNENLFKIYVNNPDALATAKGHLQRVILDTQEALDYSSGKLKEHGVSEPVREEKI